MDDSNLTAEMIKLLRDELERTRAEIRAGQPASQVASATSDARSSVSVSGELYALQEENAELKKELEALRTRAGMLPGVHRDVIRAEQLQPQFEETAKSQANAAELAHKIKVAQEKRRSLKSTKRQLKESMLESKRCLNELKNDHAHEQERLEVLQSELQQRSEQLQAQFDPSSFLQELRSIPVDASNSGTEVLAIPNHTFRLSKDMRELRAPDGHIAVNSDEVVWPGIHSRSGCLLFSTTHRYNARLNAHKGGWERTWDMEGHRGFKDIFFLKATQWYYVGTYQWVGRAILPSSELREFLTHARVYTLQKRAVLFSETLLPALVDITKTMIESGLLKLTCTGWRRVGFNSRLADALQLEHPLTTVVDEEAGQFTPETTAHTLPKKTERGIDPALSNPSDRPAKKLKRRNS